MRTFYCQNCQTELFFTNDVCPGCQCAVGFIPKQQDMVAFEISEQGWLALDGSGQYYQPCDNYLKYQACNWMIESTAKTSICASCQLTKVIPDLHEEKNIEYWRKIETAKRRFLFLMQYLYIFPRVKQNAEDELGLSFQFLVPTENQPVLTGHAGGVITLNTHEADTIYREKTRLSMGENYRTLLGHFRHESGHYYFDCLIKDTHWLASFRELFGDEQINYADALARHYDNPLQDWQDCYVSSYASSHPWEDWAETWAHYLHMMSTLHTAYHIGLNTNPVRSDAPRLSFNRSPLGDLDFQRILENWFALTYSLNSTNRSMGLGDVYPFTLSDLVQKKLEFVHRVVTEIEYQGHADSRFNQELNCQF